MLVRLNIGRNAGKVQDIETSAARAMIADGRASEVQYGEGAPATDGVAQLAVAADSAKSEKKKK